MRATNALVGLSLLVGVVVFGCAGSHRASQDEQAGDGQAGPPAGSSAMTGAAGRQPTAGTFASDDPTAQPSPTSFDAGMDESATDGPDATAAVDGGAVCRAPRRQDLISAMNAVADEVNACFAGDGTLFADLHVDPATGRLAMVAVRGTGTAEEQNCAAAVLLDRVRFTSFCLDSAGVFSIRYPFRVVGTASPRGEDDAGLAPADDGLGDTGTLRINTRPWSVVTIDGVRIGNTPQLMIELSEGTHTVELVNEEFELSKTIAVEIRAGETTTLVVALNE